MLSRHQRSSPQDDSMTREAVRRRHRVAPTRDMDTMAALLGANQVIARPPDPASEP
jgi:hypothetical protein